MGVTYKLTGEVVDFIIHQRQSQPLISCRQLAESASQKFGLRLSKSSVHDVLKGSGVTTPRGRKPKNTFQIPQEKKKQIQDSLSQVKLMKGLESSLAPGHPRFRGDDPPATVEKDMEVTTEDQEAGKIFINAALWDLGIFSDAQIKEADWPYYLTYSKGIRVVLENGQSFFIELALPLERCIRETTDGLVNNVRPLIVDKVSDLDIFKSCMEAKNGCHMKEIVIVDELYHDIVKFYNLMEHDRKYIIIKRSFVDCAENNIIKRAKILFFPNIQDENMLNDVFHLKGFHNINKEEKALTLEIDKTYDKGDLLESAAERLNSMYIYDGENRILRVKVTTKTNLLS